MSFDKSNRGTKYYVGQTFDVWWELVSYDRTPKRRYYYTLRNTANGHEIRLEERQLRKIAEGTLSVSRALKRKLWGNNRNPYGWGKRDA